MSFTKLILPAVAGIALVGCGSKTGQQLQSNPQAQKDVAKAEALYQKCVPNPFVLRSKANRNKALACMVPPQNKVPAEQCVSKGLLNGHLPTVNRIKNVVLTCVGKYA